MRTLILSERDHRDGPYGVDLLPEFGFEPIGVRPLRSAAARKLRDVVEHRTHTRVDVPLRSAPAAVSADLVLGLLEPSTELAARLKHAGVRPYAGTPLVMLSCWLAEWITRAEPEQRRALVRRFEAVDLILVLSRNQIDILVDAGFRPDQVDAIPFGCAPELFAGERIERDLEVLAAGFDHGRDYGTFFDGVRELDMMVHVLCQPANLSGLTVPENVVVHGVVPFDEYRTMLRRAQIVAVPTKELAYPTGQSVALEASAAGAAVAFSDTPALGEYFHAPFAEPVAVGNSGGWRDTIQRLHAHPAEREAMAHAGSARVREQFTYRDMWGEFTDRLASHGLMQRSRSRRA